MQRIAMPVLALSLAASVAAAGFTKTFLVPAYRPCPENVGSCPAELESSYTFATAIMRSSNRRFLKDDSVQLIIELKGVRDAAGGLVTTDPNDPNGGFVLVLPATQVTLGGTTTAPGLLAPETRIRIDLRNGKGKMNYVPPAGGETAGIVANSTESPFVVDPDGHRLALPGAMSKPSN